MSQLTVSETTRQRIPEIGEGRILEVQTIDVIVVTGRVRVELALDVHHQSRTILGPVTQDVHVKGGRLARARWSKDARVRQQSFQWEDQVVWPRTQSRAETSHSNSTSRQRLAGPMREAFGFQF